MLFVLDVDGIPLQEKKELEKISDLCISPMLTENVSWVRSTFYMVESDDLGGDSFPHPMK